MNLAHNSPHSADSPVTKYSTLPSLQYLRQTKLKIYINEALSALLAQASAQGHENGGVNGGGNSGGVKGIDVGKRPLRFLSNHFECVVRKNKQSHITAKNFTYLISTPYNRLTFLQTFLDLTSSFDKMQVTADDFHHLVLMLCPDFPRSVIHSVAWLGGEGNSKASSAKFEFSRMARGFFYWFYWAEFFLQLMVFFEAAYDGASGGSKGTKGGSGGQAKSIVMPPLISDAVKSPLRELNIVFGQSPGHSSKDQPARTSSWKRAFGCSVDISHIVVALNRIEKGCRSIGLPFVPCSIFTNSDQYINANNVVTEVGSEGVDASTALPPTKAGQKVTLERLWVNLTSDEFFDEKYRNFANNSEGGGR